MITYYGEGPLNLQMRRFKPGTSVRTRLDDILPDERRRYADRFLVVGPDGLIINIGTMVPDKVAKEVIGTNPQILDVPGFDVRIPSGYALDNSGADPVIVEAAVMAMKDESATTKGKPVEIENGDSQTPGEPAEAAEPPVETQKVETQKVEVTEKKPEPAKKKPKVKKGRGGKKSKSKKTKKSDMDDLMEMF